MEFVNLEYEKEYDATELVAEVEKRTKLADGIAEYVCETLFEVLPEALAVAGRVEIDGLGVFKLRTVKAEDWKLTDADGNVREGSAPERLKVTFKPSADWRRRIAELTGKPVI
jgi:nucleoid DNA-binding protein